MLKPHFEPNRAFYDTSITFCTHLVWPIIVISILDPNQIWSVGAVAAIFKWQLSMSHISANNIDKKLIIVSMSMFSGYRSPNMAIILVCGGCGSHFQNVFVYLSLFSGSQNPIMVIILVCGVCGSHFQNGRCECSMSHISVNNGDRNLLLVSISMFLGSTSQERHRYAWKNTEEGN